jgi:hypothetical protein
VSGPLDGLEELVQGQLRASAPPAQRGVLLAGVHVWLYPLPKDPGPAAEDLARLGVGGVIPQQGTAAVAWCRQHGRAFLERGLQVTVGLGAITSKAILGGLEVPGASGVMIDWEGAWDASGGRRRAAAIADEVLARRADAPELVADCPWWAPLTTPNRHPSHPSAPTREFGRIVRRRFVQAYGANAGSEDGHSARMLAWARDPSQYTSVGSWAVRPALQMYRRSVADHLALLLGELAGGAVCLWQHGEMDRECRLALEVVRELGARGCTGPDAVRRFQAGAGLVVDGLVGPRTCAALGLTVPPGVCWRRP